MLSAPKLSVIIPIFNASKTIQACLNSLETQTIQHELILIDDGSIDSTLEKIKPYNAKLLKQKHQGPGLARNKGAKAATGEILVFVDADMVFDKNFLKNLTAPIVAGKTQGTWTKEERVLNWDNLLAKTWNLEYTHSKTQSRIPPNAPDTSPVFRAIVKKEFDRVGGFDQVGYTDDWTLSKKLGYHALAASNAVMYHNNPGTYTEVWKQAVWISKRQYKLGEIGRFIALLRASLPISIGVGIIRSIYYWLPGYFLFKLWFDLATSWGIISYWFTGNHAK